MPGVNGEMVLYISCLNEPKNSYGYLLFLKTNIGIRAFPTFRCCSAVLASTYVFLNICACMQHVVSEFVDHLNIVIHRFYLEGQQVDEVQGANIAKVQVKDFLECLF